MSGAKLREVLLATILHGRARCRGGRAGWVYWRWPGIDGVADVASGFNEGNRDRKGVRERGGGSAGVAERLGRWRRFESSGPLSWRP